MFPVVFPLLVTALLVDCAVSGRLRSVAPLYGPTPSLHSVDGMWLLLSPGSEPVHVSAALQKAKIEVNEDGTKASAATSKT